MKLTERTIFRASTRDTDLLKVTERTDLVPSTVHIGLLKSTRRTGLQELAESIRSLKELYIETFDVRFCSLILDLFLFKAVGQTEIFIILCDPLIFSAV